MRKNIAGAIFLILIGCSLLAMMNSADAYFYTYQTQFNDSTTEKNFTFSASPSSNIFHINVLRRANVTALSMNITGWEQNQYVNYSTRTTSDSWVTLDGLTDGDISTKGDAGISNKASVYFNYSVISVVPGLNISVEFITGYADINVTVPDSCNNGIVTLNVTSVMFSGSNFQGNLQCKNFSSNSYISLYASGQHNSANIIYEVIVRERYGNSNVTLDIGNDGSKEYTNNTRWNITSEVNLNSTAIAAINSYRINNCSSNWVSGTCDIPFNITSATPGILMVFGMNATEILTYNFTMNAFDESTLSQLTYNISMTNGAQNFNTTNLTASYVIDVMNIPLGSDIIYVTSTGHSGRYYYVSSFYDSDLNITAYLVPSSVAMSEIVYVMMTNGAPIQNALVTVQYPFSGGIYSTVEQRLTDTAGAAMFSMDSSKTYHFIVSAGGHISTLFDISPNPISPVIYVKLTQTGAGGANYVNFSTFLDSISYRILPTDIYHNGTFNVTFEMVDTQFGIQYQGLNATYPNGTSFCDQFTNSQPGGTLLTCVMPNVSGHFYVHAYFKSYNYSSEYEVVATGSHTYWIFQAASSVAALTQSLKNALTDVGYWIVMIIITMVCVGFASRLVGGMPLAFMAIGIMALFVAINPTVAIEGISGWYVIGAMTLISVALMVLRSYV